MNLDETQKQRVKEWIDQGFKLSEIQSKLDGELGVRLTYMELRFLMDDLRLRPQDPEPPKEDAVPDQALGSKEKEPPGAPGLDESVPDSQGGGGVSISVDHVTRPGSVVSGRVTFSDGVSSEWYLDQLGRLGLVPPQPGYKPSQPDLMEFQSQLQRELGKHGF